MTDAPTRHEFNDMKGDLQATRTQIQDHEKECRIRGENNAAWQATTSTRLDNFKETQDKLVKTQEEQHTEIRGLRKDVVDIKHDVGSLKESVDTLAEVNREQNQKIDKLLAERITLSSILNNTKVVWGLVVIGVSIVGFILYGDIALLKLGFGVK